MSLGPVGGRTAPSPPGSGRASPVPHTTRRAIDADILKADKGLRRYGVTIDRALASWEVSPQEWADYIAFLGRLLKAIQSHPKAAPLLPYSGSVASKLAQCLNPALPSGVHQKAIEVYAYIFNTFGRDYTADHLQEFFPGLSSLLSFASLSVRPDLYKIYEENITELSPTELRPILKALILSLLPALEDEAGEDFERAFRILERLEDKFSPMRNDQDPGSEKDGYFWQCLFLTVVTSATRRQGALNFLVQKLPTFALSNRETGQTSNVTEVKSNEELPMIANAVVSPEPGLLIRCFACGLSDPQALTQRGFLDLLVSNLPLESPLLQSKIRTEDFDRLVSAATRVLLRREMSLNRRLWSWFLGPEPKSNGLCSDQQTPPDSDHKQSSQTQSNAQLQYFLRYGSTSLRRCVLAMFSRRTRSSSQTALPFRICLSLMDRWEIGGSIIPQIFFAAIESAYRYSLQASEEETKEVLRSASLFFDGVEASLIWERLLELLEDEQSDDFEHSRLRTFSWVITHFNISEEEMLTTHIPHAVVFVLSLLVDSGSRERSPTRKDDLLFAIVSRLLDILTVRSFSYSSQDVPSKSVPSDVGLDTQDIRTRIKAFYHDTTEHTDTRSNLFETRHWIQLTYRLALALLPSTDDISSELYFGRVVSLLILIHSKTSTTNLVELNDIVAAIMHTIHAMVASDRVLAFPTIDSIASLLGALGTTHDAPPVIDNHKLVQMIPGISAQAWRYLSPEVPKYNVEAVKLTWQLQEIAHTNDCLEASLMCLVSNGLSNSGTEQNTGAETCRRFAVLWNHTLPATARTAQGSPVSSRKASLMPSLTDATRVAKRQRILTGPLWLVLDELRSEQDSANGVVRSWLHHLPSLDRVLNIIFDRLEELMCLQQHSERSQRKEKDRQTSERLRGLEYTVDHVLNLLTIANDQAWESLKDITISGTSGDDAQEVAVRLTKHCMAFIKGPEYFHTKLPNKSIDIISIVLSSPLKIQVKDLDLESHLIDQLMHLLMEDRAELQEELLKLTSKALQLRMTPSIQEPAHHINSRRSFTRQRLPGAAIHHSPSSSNTSLTAQPPVQLLNCLKMGFTSNAARFHMDEWLAFLSAVLPTYADAIFASIIPLVESLCLELEKIVASIISMSKMDKAEQLYAPENGAITLLDALGMILLRAHDSLTEEQEVDATPKPPIQSRGILGSMTTSVFKPGAPPTRSTQANSRLTVILTFQDTIRACTRLWTWASHNSETDGFDKGSAATTTYIALRLRSRTKHLLEQIFDNEPLESLEVFIHIWYHAESLTSASAILNLLHTMQGLRPKAIVPTILDSICSRTNPSALPPQRQSSQTIDFSATDATQFLYAYLQSVEDDAMDEVWPDCTAFMRDVLANPLPYRLVLPSVLLIVLLLAHQIDNTNFGEQRKMRRELGDTFMRLLGATFTTMPLGYILESSSMETTASTATGDLDSQHQRQPANLTAVLNELTPNLDVIMETSDRVLAAMNNISTNLITPVVHARSFPNQVTSEILILFLQIAKRAPSAKQWKKDLTDAFYDPRLLTVPVLQMENDWFPLFRHWCLYDKDRMPDLLSKITAPSSAGIMFGVGASATRLEADRKTQFTLRRICMLLLSSPEDSFVLHLRTLEEKVTELFDASPSSSPSSLVKAELFMLGRALVLSTSAVHLAPFWPIINDHMQSALVSLLPSGSNDTKLSNLSLLQVCKLLDILVALAPEEFQLYEWLYITDTIDAVYQPSHWNPSALSDTVAESLSHASPGDSSDIIPQTPLAGATSGKRRPLIGNSGLLDPADIRALTMEDFARTVVQPFLSQLSLYAYEGAYSMDAPDAGVCRRSLLEDLLDSRTIVE